MNIAIPTYKRSHLIEGLTLGFLDRCGISRDYVRLYVSNEQEAVLYKHTGCTIINTNCGNVRDKFNFIHSFYEPGAEVLVIEDDIESIQKLAGYNKLEEISDLQQQAEKAFKLCHEHHTKLWGISSNSNPFFLADKAGPCFKLIVANMYGFIAEELPILVTQYTKTDYERTILYTIKYNSVVRLDYLCPITKNYKNEGGMQEEKQFRYDRELVAVNYLTSRYPDMCKRNESKGSIYPEIQLRTMRVEPKQNLFNL